MEENLIIKYVSKTLGGTEYINIFEDKIVYVRNDLAIASKDKEPNESSKISIKSTSYVQNKILGDIYNKKKSDMKKSYDKVKEMDPRNITRPKNTARKQLVINDEDFKAVIDMYVKEYGEIFREFVEELKVEIIRKISN